MANGKPKTKQTCTLCRRPIGGRVYYQGGQCSHPVHKNCRMVIRGPRRGE